MRIGLDTYTVAARGLSAHELLEFARARDLAGLQFAEATAIDPNLRPGPLREFKAEAQRRGLYVEIGIPSPNPFRGEALHEGGATSPADHVARLMPHLDAAVALGCETVRAYVGDRHDRFRRDVSWGDQLDATTRVLRHAAPALRDRNLRVALETHADLTTRELLRTLDAVGHEIAAVTLDTGNLMMRLEEPLGAVERVAPFVVATHLKDAVLTFTDRGLAWQVRPLGAGIVPIPDILGVLQRHQPRVNLSIELHPRTYDLPIFDRSWLDYFPELAPADLAALVKAAWACEERYRDGLGSRPDQVERVPWDQRDLDWLAQSVGYLRPIVDLLNTL